MTFTQKQIFAGRAVGGTATAAGSAGNAGGGLGAATDPAGAGAAWALLRTGTGR